MHGLTTAADPRGADPDPTETSEWLAALNSVRRFAGSERATFLLRALAREAARHGVVADAPPFSPYRNTISVERQPPFPGDLAMEERITAIVRWNALVMVMRANKASSELGGHIASYASAAEIFEVGFNHFFRADDIVFFQPHSAPASTPAPFLKGESPRSGLSTIAARSAAAASVPIRTPG